MTESIETKATAEENEIIESIRGELNALSLNIKKESFKARQQLKDEIKRLGFYDGDENGENIKFNIGKVKEYLKGIKDKSWTDLDLKSSALEKGVWTIAIQIAINYINKNGNSATNMDLIDGIRGKQTRKSVKDFQTKYGLKNKDGLPGRETMNKILELLGNDSNETSESGSGDKEGNIKTSENESGSSNQGNNKTEKTPEQNDLGKADNPHSGEIEQLSPDNQESNPGENEQGKTDNPENHSGGNEQGSPDNQRSNPGDSEQGKTDNPENHSGEIEQGSPDNQESSPGESELGKADNPEDNTIIEDDKCVQLCENLDVQKDSNSGNSSETNKESDSFENRLNEKLKDVGKLEGAILKNPKIQGLLGSIINRQGQVIQRMKKKYEKNKGEEDKIKAQKEKNGEISDDKKAEKSWEEFKFENFSQKSFEEFILSDEGIAVVIDEIKSHIDTNHENKDEKYDKFYEKYPISEKNLEIKLRIAWESKMKSNFYKEIYKDEEKREEMEKKDVLSNKIIEYIDKIVGDNMKSGNADFNQDVIGGLNGLLSKGIDGAPIKEIFSDLDQKDSFKEILASKIKIYHSLVKNKEDVNLNTGDKQVDLQLKSYLFIYGCIFYSKFKSDKDIRYYEHKLPDVMRCIVSNDDKSLINNIEHEEFLEEERKQEEARQKRDLKRRQEAAKRNTELNRKILAGSRKGGEYKQNNGDSNSNDVNHETGEQLAKNINLDDYDTQTDLSEVADSSNTKQLAFLAAWKNFTKSNSIIKQFSLDDMRLIFDTETNRINENNRKEFLNRDIMKGRPQKEIDEIYRILSSFPMEYNKALKQITYGITKQEGAIDNKIKNSALGSVIDNVKSIFANIVKKWEGNSKFEGFKFDEAEPVKRQGNDIIISGTFNGVDTKVRYDLVSGELFINSFFQHPSNSEIVFGKNSDANLKIGQLDSFDKILDNHYSSPDISLTSDTHIQNVGLSDKSDQPINPYATVMQIRNQTMKNLDKIKEKYSKMFNANFDMISDTVVDNSKKQNAINSTVTKFMKTFNIIPDSGEFSSLQFHKGSNLFDLVQIIEETGSSKKNEIQSLEYFNNEFMPMIMKYSCLKWGDNNLYGPQKNEENKYYYDDTFNDKNRNEQISLIRESANDFSQNLQRFKPGGTRNYDSDYQLGFAGFIKENFVKGSQPNRNLDISKMKEFVHDLKTKNKEYSDTSDEYLDEELDKNLANLA